MTTREVWKYPFKTTSPITVEVPYAAKIVHVGVDPADDGFLPCVWIERQTQRPAKMQWVLSFVGTGMEIDDDRVHVGSVVTPNGLVWHVYRRTERALP